MESISDKIKDLETKSLKYLPIPKERIGKKRITDTHVYAFIVVIVFLGLVSFKPSFTLEEQGALAEGERKVIWLKLISWTLVLSFVIITALYVTRKKLNS